MQALEKEGVVFIGPGTLAMEKMGDKIESKKVADDAGATCVKFMKTSVA